ncbi:MAG: hypothetical protein KDK70_23975 [Myxococcales bacterium]|nr:hypothetical protein [Myxococcales bacterium]
MSSPPRLSVVPRDPTSPPPSISLPELSSSLAQSWDRWHPSDSAADEAPWPFEDAVDQRVRDLAWMTIEKLWDEIAEIGHGTGEVVSFDMFPSPIGGYRRRVLEPVD